MTGIAILRPEPGASASLERARKLGLNAFALPLFEIVPVDWNVPDPDRFDGVLLTSANALRHAGPGLKALRGLPAYCVGPATARAAEEAGFHVSAVGAGGVGQLLDSLEPAKGLLHLCGRDRAEPPAGQKIVAVPVYEARTREHVEGLERLEGTVALAHSPRAGERLAELADAGHFDRSRVVIAAISPAAMRAAGKGWKAARFTVEPRDGALLALAAELCEKIESE